MYCEPKYLLMVFAFAGDSTITKARLFAADSEDAVAFLLVDRGHSP
jgi:hypothetical protein